MCFAALLERSSPSEIRTFRRAAERAFSEISKRQVLDHLAGNVAPPFPGNFSALVVEVGLFQSVKQIALATRCRVQAVLLIERGVQFRGRVGCAGSQCGAFEHHHFVFALHPHWI